MSSTLMWKPVQSYKGSFHSGIKFILQEHFDEGTIHNCHLEESDIPYLKGIMAAGSKEIKADAKKMIELILRHDLIIITEQF